MKFIVRLSEDVMNVNSPAFERRPARNGTWPNANGVSLQVFFELRVGAGRDTHTKELTIQPVHVATIRSAEPRRVFDEGFQHRLEIERRTADHLQHFAGGRLLL